MGKVLIVDDSRAIRMKLSRILMDMGFDVTATGSGRAALEAVENQMQTFTTIFVDCKMPGMDGSTFARTLRAKPRYTQIPLIWMAADATELAEVEELPELSAAPSIDKPFTKEDVAAALAQLKQRRHAS